MDRLIGILWDIVCKRNISGKDLHKILRHIFFFCFVLWSLIILPGIPVAEMSSSQTVKTGICHNSNPELYSVKHHIAVIRKKTAVIGQGHQPCDLHILISDLHGIPNRQMVIIRIHTVNGDLILCLWKLSFHHTDQIHACPVLVNSHGSVCLPVRICVCIFFHKEVFFNPDSFLFQPFQLCLRSL